MRLEWLRILHKFQSLSARNLFKYLLAKVFFFIFTESGIAKFKFQLFVSTQNTKKKFSTLLQEFDDSLEKLNVIHSRAIHASTPVAYDTNRYFWTCKNLQISLLTISPQKARRGVHVFNGIWKKGRRRRRWEGEAYTRTWLDFMSCAIKRNRHDLNSLLLILLYNFRLFIFDWN